jgi:hypothetical protein
MAAGMTIQERTETFQILGSDSLVLYHPALTVVKPLSVLLGSTEIEAPGGRNKTKPAAGRHRLFQLGLAGWLAAPISEHPRLQGKLAPNPGPMCARISRP